MQTPERIAYKGARYRCTSPKCAAWVNYGGRGIEFRFSSFEEFLEDIGLRPSQRHQLDRINNDGHYEKGNVRWVLPAVNHANKRQHKRDRVNNKSGFKGVHVYGGQSRKPWKAQIRINNQSVYLGLFSSPVEAARVYDAAAKEAFGASAVLNFPQR